MQFLLGFIIGAIVLGLVIWKMMPKLMCITKESRLDFESTVQRAQDEAIALGWKVSHVYNMKQSFEKAGNKNVQKMMVVSLGNAKQAYSIVKNDKDKNILGFMPYCLGVYEDKGHL